jgi:hypothetical protein
MSLAPDVARVVVPAREGRAVRLCAGDRATVVDVSRGQVGDVFAFNANDPSEFLSASHTRGATSSLFPAIGQAFVTNRRRAILELVDDTSQGAHDMLIAACEPARYADLGDPVHWSLDDWEQYAFLPEPHVGSVIESPLKALEMWDHELQAARELHTLFNLCSHPFLTGRAGRLVALRTLIERAQERGGVRFSTCHDLALLVAPDEGARVVDSPPCCRTPRPIRSTDDGTR